MRLNIVIPVLNEEKALEHGVETTIRYLDGTELSGNYRITIADNGSTDDTERIARLLCDRYSHVDYFKVSQRGVGLAFREAIKRNTCEIVGYMDVDLATDIKHLRQVYRFFTEQNAEAVVGSRLLKGSEVHNRTLVREITSRSLNLILKLILHVNFSDAMCGFKFYRKETALRLTELCSQNTGWFYCAEMMIRAEWEEIPIVEIAVQWHDDSDSKVKIGKLSSEYMAEIMKLRKEKRRRRS